MNSPPTEPRPDDPRDDFDRAITSALRQVTPPAGLREQLLAIPAAEAAPANVVRGPWANWPRRAVWLAAAAVLAMAALFGWRRQADRWSFEEFRLAAANEIVPRIQGSERPGRMHLDFLSKDPAAIAAWLRAQGAPEPAAEALLRADAGFGPVGCKALEWHGVRYSLACFYTADRRSVHLFTIPLAAFPAGSLPAAGARPEMHRFGGREVATWTEGTLVRVLVAAEEATSLPAVLAL